MIARGLYIRSHVHGADTSWTFGLSLMGALRYVPASHCVKRYYAGSTSAIAAYGVRDVLDGLRVLRSYVADSRLPWRGRLLARLGLLAWTALRLIGRVAPRFSRPLGYWMAYRMLPDVVRPAMRRLGGTWGPFPYSAEDR